MQARTRIAQASDYGGERSRGREGIPEVLGKASEEAVSRVLCAARRAAGRPFLYGARHRAPSAAWTRGHRAGSPSPDGQIAAGSPSYSALLRVGFAVPRRSPAAR